MDKEIDRIIASVENFGGALSKKTYKDICSINDYKCYKETLTTKSTGNSSKIAIGISVALLVAGGIGLFSSHLGNGSAKQIDNEVVTSHTDSISNLLDKGINESNSNLSVNETHQKSNWPKYLLLLGITSLAYGTYKNRKNTDQIVNSVFDPDKSIDNLLTKVDAILSKQSNEWEKFMCDTKTEVQSFIQGLSLDDVQKDKLMYYTYMIDYFHLSSESLSDRISNADADGMGGDEIDVQRDAFAQMVQDRIVKTVESQLNKYQSIKKILEDYGC